MARARVTIVPLGASIALIAGSLACSSSLPVPELERFDISITPTAADYPDVPAVVLLDRGSLLLTADVERRTPLGRLRRYRRIKILRESGAALARVEAPYDPGSAVTGLVARVVLPDGRTFDADPANVTDTRHPSGRRAKALQVPAVVPGAVVEYAYDVYVDDLRFVPPWIFQSELPTVRSEFAVIVPPGYEVDLRYSEGGLFVTRPPERFDTPEGTRFSWSMSNLPAQFVEANMPDAGLLAPRAHVIYLGATVAGRRFDGFGSWESVGAWFISRVPNWAELSPETVAEAKRVAGDGGLQERALKLLEVLARDIPEEPDSAAPLWRARLVHPEIVLREKRANPSSRGLLLVSLLNAAGITAVPGLFAYRDRDVLLPDVPTVRSLHGVAAVIPQPQGPLILDPSELTVSADVAPPRLQGTRIVALHGDIAEVVLAPRSRPEDSRTEIDYALEVDRRGDLFGSLKATLTGAEAGELRGLLLESKPEDYAAVVSDFTRSRGCGLPVESVSIADLSALRRPLVLSGSVNVRGAIVGEGTELLVPVGRIVGNAASEVREVRRAPLLRSAPHAVEIRATVTLPEDWELGELPPPSEESWSGGKVQIMVRGETRRRIGIVRKSTVLALEVEAKGWARYRQFVQSVKIAEDQTFIIKRPPPRELEF